MIRGMYFMNWFPRDWNYHPMLPPKRLQNVQEIEAMNCNMLYWCSMGSGMIGLQMLDEELFGQPANRTRFYGFLNDSEFAAECSSRGIKSFGVIWRAQLWEFPAEFNEDETQLLSMNKLRGVGKRGWVGMSELSTDRYPRIFKSIKEFFPDGLKNSKGENVGDFLEEFTVKTLEGNKILSSWLLVPGHEHKCYTPCCNNYAFRGYLHKELEMMIDAGTSGIFFDEHDTARIALLNSGCFCPDCMAAFRDHLKKNPCKESEGLDLDSFDYGDFLRMKGYRDRDLDGALKQMRLEIPLFRSWIDFNYISNREVVRDMADHARAYAAKCGRKVELASNLYNFRPETAFSRKYMDYYGGELSGIDLRQDGFYRYAFGYIGGKEGFFTQDYSPYILEIVDDIKHGKNDTYTLMLMEPMAHGCMLSVPYGSWLLNQSKESFWPDVAWDTVLGKWITENERLFPRNPAATTAVIYDWCAAYEVDAYLGGHTDSPRISGFPLFYETVQQLCDEGIQFNVLFVDPDEPLTRQRLSGYKSVILPDCTGLNGDAKSILKSAAGEGLRLAVTGKPDIELYDYVLIPQKGVGLSGWIRQDRQLCTPAAPSKDFGTSLHKIEGGYLLNVVNYSLDTKSRMIDELPELTFELAFQPKQIIVHQLPGEFDAAAAYENGLLKLRHAGIYTALELLI